MSIPFGGPFVRNNRERKRKRKKRKTQGERERESFPHCEFVSCILSINPSFDNEEGKKNYVSTLWKYSRNRKHNFFLFLSRELLHFSFLFGLIDVIWLERQYKRFHAFSARYLLKGEEKKRRSEKRPFCICVNFDTSEKRNLKTFFSAALNTDSTSFFFLLLLLVVVIIIIVASFSFFRFFLNRQESRHSNCFQIALYVFFVIVANQTVIPISGCSHSNLPSHPSINVNETEEYRNPENLQFVFRLLSSSKQLHVFDSVARYVCVSFVNKREVRNSKCYCYIATIKNNVLNGGKGRRKRRKRRREVDVSNTLW